MSVGWLVGWFLNKYLLVDIQSAGCLKELYYLGTTTRYPLRRRIVFPSRRDVLQLPPLDSAGPTSNVRYQRGLSCWHVCAQ